jgi:FkbM family methyltransferase
MNRKLRPNALVSVLRHVRSISFSFYSEDAILYHMKPRHQGFYVDVGAFHPVHMSNTYKLYLKGWCGITIEPDPIRAPLFRRHRPADQHLTAGVAAEQSTLTYYQFDDPVLNTLDAGRAAEVPARLINTVAVECQPLGNILDRHAPDKPVDLLSVDCEGMDLIVLQSLNWARQRPTVIIVEDIEAFRMGAAATPTHSPIRRFLVQKDYVLAAQSIFSFIYVDKFALKHTSSRGFDLSRSQVDLLLHRSEIC